MRVLHKREAGRWLLGLLLANICVLITYMCFPVLFATNDDTRIMYAVAGYASGEFYPAQQFINLFFGQLLSFFYGICPVLPWYTVYHMVMLGLSITLINKSIFKAYAHWNRSLFQAILTVVAVYFIFFVHVTFMFQFTTTAAICGTSSMAVAMMWNMEGDKKGTVVLDAVCIVAMLFFGFILRAYSIYCVLCFIALAGVYRIGTLCIEGKTKRRIIQIGIVVLTAIVALVAVRQYSLGMKAQDPRTVEYDAYNSYRTAYQDFPSKTYSKNKELYKSVGWDSDLYAATRKLLYMDSRINEEKLKLLTEEFSLTGITADRSLSAAWKTAKTLLDSSRIPSIYLFGILLLFAINIIQWLGSSEKKRRLISLLCAICGVAGCGMLMFYLCWNGRFPLRTMQTIVFPAAVMQAVLVPTLQERMDKSYRIIFKLGASALFSLLLVMTGFQVKYTSDNLDVVLKPATKTTATMEDATAFERYAMENPDNLYVYDFTVATVMRNAFCIYPENKPINCIIAGGSYTYSALYYDQLAAMNREHLYWTDLCEDGVYYVTESDDFLKTVHKNINRDMGYEVECVEVMHINVSGGNGIGIYKFG